MKVKDLMTRVVKFCTSFDTLNTAAKIMWDNDVGCVPVVDKSGRVIGMLTDRDICMAAYTQGVPLMGAQVTSAMSKEVISCSPADDLAKAESLMRDKQVRRLPVLDAHGRLAGIISLNDIAREGEREAAMKRVREISDAEIARVMASVCAPRRRIIEAHA
jgi:CBS domain-containing protein